MLKTTKFRNPKKWYQKLILKLFNLEYYHIEFELEFENEKKYFLKSNYEENIITEEYISNLRENVYKQCYVTTLEQEKEIFEYFLSINNTKYNYFQIFRWLIDYKIRKIDVKDFKNNTINNKYNCYNHFININKIINNKLK